MGCKSVEVNEVLHYVLVVVHAEIFQVDFGFTFGVMRSEVFSQLQDKVGVIIESGRVETGGQQGFEPVKRCSLEIR